MSEATPNTLQRCPICGDSAAYVLKDGELRCIRHFNPVITIEVEPVESTEIIVVKAYVPFRATDEEITDALDEIRTRLAVQTGRVRT